MFKRAEKKYFTLKNNLAYWYLRDLATGGCCWSATAWGEKYTIKIFLLPSIVWRRQSSVLSIKKVLLKAMSSGSRTQCSALPKGWIREEIPRQTSNIHGVGGRVDVYYISPAGKKIRWGRFMSFNRHPLNSPEFITHRLWVYIYLNLSLPLSNST